MIFFGHLFSACHAKYSTSRWAKYCASLLLLTLWLLVLPVSGDGIRERGCPLGKLNPTFARQRGKKTPHPTHTPFHLDGGYNTNGGFEGQKVRAIQRGLIDLLIKPPMVAIFWLWSCLNSFGAISQSHVISLLIWTGVQKCLGEKRSDEPLNEVETNEAREPASCHIKKLSSGLLHSQLYYGWC